MKYLLGLALIFVSLQIQAPGSLPLISQSEFNCLTDNAYHEARGEGLKGMELVTHVVMNRAEGRKKSFCKIVYEPYQSSWTIVKKSKKGAHQKKGASARQVASRLAAATAVFNVVSQRDPSQQRGNLHSEIYLATHYHTNQVSPSWAVRLKFLGKFKNHLFYY